MIYVRGLGFGINQVLLVSQVCPSRKRLPVRIHVRLCTERRFYISKAGWLDDAYVRGRFIGGSDFGSRKFTSVMT